MLELVPILSCPGGKSGQNVDQSWLILVVPVSAKVALISTNSGRRSTKSVPKSTRFGESPDHIRPRFDRTLSNFGQHWPASSNFGRSRSHFDRNQPNSVKQREISPNSGRTRSIPTTCWPNVGQAWTKFHRAREHLAASARRLQLAQHLQENSGTPAIHRFRRWRTLRKWRERASSLDWQN